MSHPLSRFAAPPSLASLDGDAVPWHGPIHGFTGLGHASYVRSWR